eukprot:g13123.t1
MVLDNTKRNPFVIALRVLILCTCIYIACGVNNPGDTREKKILVPNKEERMKRNFMYSHQRFYKDKDQVNCWYKTSGYEKRKYDKEVFNRLNTCPSKTIYLLFGTNAFNQECVTEEQLKTALNSVWGKDIEAAQHLLDNVRAVENAIGQDVESRKDIPEKLRYLSDIMRVMVNHPDIIKRGRKVKQTKETIEKNKDKIIELTHKIIEEEKKLLIQAIKIRIISGLDRVKDPIASELSKRMLRKWIRTYNKLGMKFGLVKENLFKYTREQIYPLNETYTWYTEKKVKSHLRVSFNKLVEEDAKRYRKKKAKLLAKTFRTQIVTFDKELKGKEASVSALYNIMESYLCVRHTKHTYKGKENFVKPGNDEVGNRVMQGVLGSVCADWMKKKKKTCSAGGPRSRDDHKRRKCREEKKNSERKYEENKCIDVEKELKEIAKCNMAEKKKNKLCFRKQCKREKKKATVEWEEKCVPLFKRSYIRTRRRLLANLKNTRSLNYRELWEHFTNNVQSDGTCKASILKKVRVEPNGNFHFSCSTANELCTCIFNVGETGKEAKFYSPDETLALNVFKDGNTTAYEILESGEAVGYGDVNEGRMDRRRRLLQLGGGNS